LSYDHNRWVSTANAGRRSKFQSYHIVTREQASHSATLFASSIFALAEAPAAPAAGFGRTQHPADLSQAASIVLRHVPSQTMKKIDIYLKPS